MSIREYLEDIEEKTLSPFAVKSKNTKGRLHPIPKCDIRTEFQRDRDRIIHSKAFRRLKHKTQVFITPEGDHYRTRLTHTLEVSQIARTIARALRLNEDLVEAMALGHDLGHTPFGHAGEVVLNKLCRHGFCHNEQSLRVVDVLEGKGGLNLTWEVRDGILNHNGENEAATLEGKIIKLADRIAYINHDIDDAIRAEIIKAEDPPKGPIEILGKTHGERIDTMIKDVIYTSQDKPYVKMSDSVRQATDELREFMFSNVYIDSNAKTEEKKAKDMIEKLFVYFINNIDKLPGETKKRLEFDDADRVVADYIAGMTDNYAVYVFNEIFVPKSWQKR